jgi:hypothetical protein
MSFSIKTLGLWDFIIIYIFILKVHQFDFYNFLHENIWKNEHSTFMLKSLRFIYIYNTKFHKEVVIKTNFIIMCFKICKCLQICFLWKISLGRMNRLSIEPLPNLHCMMNYDTFIQQVNSMKLLCGFCYVLWVKIVVINWRLHFATILKITIKDIKHFMATIWISMHNNFCDLLNRLNKYFIETCKL